MGRRSWAAAGDPPQWLPTPAQRRARAANASLHRLADEILQTCRADPDRDAPLVRALLAAATRRPDSRSPTTEICNELVLFMLAGHDTTSTTLTYALWALGHHRDLQDRVAAEVAELGDRPLTPRIVPRLGYTVQVLHEALRLCPPGAGIGRLAMQDIDVDGYRVEAGTLAMVGIYAMHRDPALWDNPLVFDPDRFSPQRSKGRAAGSTCRSAAGRAPASVITSPCWRPPWRWRPSSGQARDPFAGRRFPLRHAVHPGRRRADPGPRTAAGLPPHGQDHEATPWEDAEAGEVLGSMSK